MAKYVYDDYIYKPSEYIDKFFNEWSGDLVDVSLMRLNDWLEEHGHTEIWYYLLSEIDEIVENKLTVVLVRDNDGDYRWFEVPDEFVKE